MKIHQFPRTKLAYLPTPLEELKNLSAELAGPRLLIKRDDQTGLALGGNKTRKLEFSLAEALEQDADTVITAGAAQSNHCRQTAAAAARTHLHCELVLGGTEPALPNGNLLLDRLFGATVHWTGPHRRGERMEEIADQIRAAGRRPYLIPVGASNATGALGYVAALQELAQQLEQLPYKIDHLVFASSSGGTQAGLVVGARLTGFSARIIGISVDKALDEPEPYDSFLVRLSNELAEKLDLKDNFSPTDFIIDYNYMTPGYGVLTDLERRAISLLARSEGILLDPVYTGRAFGALIDMIQRKVFSPDETVLFWHTGGAPALFAYADKLIP